MSSRWLSKTTLKSALAPSRFALSLLASHVGASYRAMHAHSRSLSIRLWHLRPSIRILAPVCLWTLAALAIVEHTPRHLPIDAAKPMTYTPTIVMAPDSATRLAAGIARFLKPYGADAPVRARIARAIVRESGRTHLDPSLLVGVLLVENPDLKPSARNPNSGALGLMQVMPFHAGEYSCGTRNLRQIEANICHGSHLLASLVREAKGSHQRALLMYNGCRTGSVTPTCFSYPDAVRLRAQRSRRFLARSMASEE